MVEFIAGVVIGIVTGVIGTLVILQILIRKEFDDALKRL